MAWTFETATEITIPNVLVERGLLDGVHKNYRLSANDGYVLHDAEADNWDPDGNLVYAYSSGICSCGKNYDFSTETLNVPDINGNTVAVTAYGTRQFFAFPENLVPNPEDNIYGGGNNQEVM